MQKTCPVCAAPGEDLVFKFECTNPECQNFVKRAEQSAPHESGESEEDDSDLEDYGLDWMMCSD